MAQNTKANIRRAVHGRIRKKVSGTTARPRLAVYRSLNHIYAQIVDDVAGRTVAAASTIERDVRASATGNRTAAEKIGSMIAERAKAAGVGKVVFDRNGFIYHGRVKALADAARKAGLEF